MNVLVLNGSPKGARSNSYQLTKAFVAGMREGEADLQVQELSVSRMNIRPCLGCFSCWSKTPGKCCIEDDMAQVLEKLLWADVTIWSFPLYYFSVPGGLKNLIDRQLPLLLPFMEESGGETGGGSHPTRYDMRGKRTVVISTCGFHTAQGNYDGVRSLFDHICGKDGYTAVFCGQGELFHVPDVKQRTDEYLRFVQQAGREYMAGGISAQTREKLDQPLFPRKVFEAWANASWGVDAKTGERESETLIFTRQMAALYRPESWNGHDLVLEMDYTDVGERYQIVLRKVESRVLKEDFLPATTTISTPVTVWQAIAAGEVSGSEALMRHQYRVDGDFSLLLNWDNYFSGTDDAAPAANEQAKETANKGALAQTKPTNLIILLLPWIVCWAAVSIDAFWGSLATLFACVLVPLVFYRHRKTFYDVLTVAIVTCVSVAALLGAPIRWVIPLSYLAFGVMWSVSCLRKIPLTAQYSMNNYGGDSALQNPLFLKTNRILTLAWGVLYLLTPIWTYFILGTQIGGWVGAINSVLPVFMGIFTAWFQKWYPAKVARG